MNVYYFENLRKYVPGVTPPVMPYRMPAVARREVAQFDVVHIHDHRTLLTVIASHYARKYGVPYVLQAHGALPQDTGSARMKRLFDLLWTKKVILGAAGVIALNETEAECYRELGVEEGSHPKRHRFCGALTFRPAAGSAQSGALTMLQGRALPRAARPDEGDRSPDPLVCRGRPGVR